jgi:hypothetical protein
MSPSALVVFYKLLSSTFESAHLLKVNSTQRVEVAGLIVKHWGQ